MASSSQKITFSTSRLGRAPLLGLIVPALLITASPAAAQLSTTQLSTTTTACSPVTQTRLVEWDISSFGDFVPGGLTVDDRSSSRQSKVWFVTRNGANRVHRFTPGRAFRKDYASVVSWDLGSIRTGGVRLRHSSDGRFIFVNTTQETQEGGLVAVDTKDDTRVTWFDRPPASTAPAPVPQQMSDVSVDTRGSGHSVFTAAPRYYRDDTRTGTDGVDGVVQSLRPRSAEWKGDRWVVPADVTRYLVGGGAGTCRDTGAGAPCIPGVVVDHRRGHPIYFSAPTWVTPEGVGAIGEIDPRPVKCSLYDQYNSCVKVRYWPLPNVDPSGFPVDGPRQILLDESGKVWGITSSGHLFSLEVDRSRDKGTVTLHDPVGPGEEDLFAVAPDGGIVGYTDSNNHEVSVLFPARVKDPVEPDIKLVKFVNRRLEGLREAAGRKDHVLDPRVADATAFQYTQTDGTYIETEVITGISADGSFPSASPTGMTPDGTRKTGSFFYGVTTTFNTDTETLEDPSTTNTNRIGHFEINFEPEREVDYRKDDDDYDDDGDDDEYDADDDGDGKFDSADDDDDNDCIPDLLDKDHDNDGVENEHDSKSHRENKRSDRGEMTPGEWKSYEMYSDSNSVAMVTIVEAADLSTPLSIEIVDPNGVIILATPPVLGKAAVTTTPALPGVYTVRVKNGGLRTTSYKTTLIGKSIWF